MAMEDAKAAEEGVNIPMGRRSIFKSPLRNALKKRRNKNSPYR
jgi:hypothetical protein